MNYREVKCSDKLPETGLVLTPKGMREYNGTYWINYSGIGTGKVAVESWLEPYELPTEEIADIIYKEFKHGKSGAFTVCADRAAKAITKLIKGER